jgi:hypothetical protein
LFFLALFVFPVAVYCLVLGLINRRPHPVLVSGPWDFFGLLLAASGLILFGGPAILTLFYDREVRDFLLGRLRSPQFEFAALLAKWWILWLLYYLVVVGGSAALLWMRREVTSIYNIEPAVFDEVFAQLLDRLGLEWTRLGNRIFVGFRGLTRPGPPPLPPTGPDSEHVRGDVLPLPAAQPFPTLARPDQEAVIDVEPFYATRHVTLNWRSSAGQTRQEIEAELGRVLGEVHTPYNPAGGWLMLIASCFFLIVLGVVMLLCIQLWMRPR